LRTGALPAELDPLEPGVLPPLLEPGADVDLQELALQTMLGNGVLANARAPVVAPVPPPELKEASVPREQETAEAEGPPEPEPVASPLATSLQAILSSLLGEAAASLEVLSDAKHDQQLAESGAGAAVCDGALVLPTGQQMPTTPAAGRALLTAVRQALAGVEGPVDPSAPVPPPGDEEFAPAESVPGEAPMPEEELTAEEPAVEVPVAAEEQRPAEEAVAEAPAPDVAPEGEAAPAVEAEVRVAPGPVEERPGWKLMMPPAPTQPGTGQVERATKVSGAARRASRSAAALPSAGETTARARKAVEEPKAETDANVRRDLAELIGEHPPPNPAIVKLCDDIRTAIRERRPVEEDDLTSANPQGVAEEVGGSLNSKIDSDVQSVDKGYDALDNPPQGKAATKPVPLDAPPPMGAPDIAADAAAPDPIPDKDLSLDADQAQVAQRVGESGINRPTTEQITDPPFSTVREGQGELEALAKQTPAELAAQQQQAIADAQASMTELQGNAVAALKAARSETVGGVSGRQKRMVGTEEQKRTELSKQALAIFSSTRDQVNKLIGPLPREAMKSWKADVERLSGEFKATLAEVQSWIDERHAGVGGFFLRIADWTGLPGWVTESYDKAEERFGDGVCAALQEISDHVDTQIAAAQVLINIARERIDGLFTGLEPGLEEWAAGERAKFHGQLDALSKQTLGTRDAFVKDVSRRAITAVAEVQEEVEKRREEAKGVIGRIADAIQEFIDDPVRAIINGLLSLVGIPPPAFWALVEKIKQAIEDIADDPVGFFNHLVDGLKQGFSGFFDRFPRHLLQGFWDWLFSGLGSVGVKLPADTSIPNLVTFVLQVMGITWPRIREILVKHIGEENVELIERAWELISTLIERGPEGIFTMIKERLDPGTIVQEILKAAVDYLVEAIVKSVAVRLLMLFNPAGAILQAIELIYKVGKWIFQNAARIFRLVETVVNGIVDIIAGNVSAFAGAVEKALASLISPVIGFIAEYFNLGDLPLKIADVIKQLQDWVLRIIDGVIGFLVEKAKALLAAIGLGGDEEEKEGAGDEELGRDVGFSAAGEHHHQWIALSGEVAVPMVASEEKTVDEQLSEWKQEAPTKFKGQPERLAEAQGLISSAQSQLAKLETDADELAPAFVKASTEEKPPSDAAVEGEQLTLTQVLAKLYELFGQKPDPKILFADQLGLMVNEAREPVVALLVSLDPLPTEWVKAKEESSTGKVRDILDAPLNKEYAFGKWAHVWGAAATKSGIDQALGEYAGAVTSDPPLARKIKSMRLHLTDLGRIEAGVIKAPGASDFLTDYKGQINDRADPFAEVVPAVDLTFWVQAEQGSAAGKITLAFAARIRLGTGSPAALPDDVRAYILEQIAGAELIFEPLGGAFRVRLDERFEADLMNYLDTQAKLDQYDEAAMRSLKWWRDHLFQKEFHHAWPKWLRGRQDQTVIYLPRALHNFRGLAGQEFPGGFHQIFNAIFESEFGSLGLKAEKSETWDAYTLAKPEAIARVRLLLVAAYEELFKTFEASPDAATAKNAFVAEVNSFPIKP
jgi:hypothetical protein